MYIVSAKIKRIYKSLLSGMSDREIDMRWNADRSQIADVTGY